MWPVLASVGLLSANSFVNRKFGSHGTEDGVRLFLRTLFGWELSNVWGEEHIWPSPTFCLGEEAEPDWHKLLEPENLVVRIFSSSIFGGLKW